MNETFGMVMAVKLLKRFWLIQIAFLYYGSYLTTRSCTTAIVMNTFTKYVAIKPVFDVEKYSQYSIDAGGKFFLV